MPLYRSTGRGSGPPIHRLEYTITLAQKKQVFYFLREFNGEQTACTAGMQEDDIFVLIEITCTEHAQEQ